MRYTPQATNTRPQSIHGSMSTTDYASLHKVVLILKQLHVNGFSIFCMTMKHSYMVKVNNSIQRSVSNSNINIYFKSVQRAIFMNSFIIKRTIIINHNYVRMSIIKSGESASKGFKVMHFFHSIGDPGKNSASPERTVHTPRPVGNTARLNKFCVGRFSLV